MEFNQNVDTIHRLLDTAKPEAAYSLGVITSQAIHDGVVLTDDILEQVAASNDLNDAVGYYANWLARYKGLRVAEPGASPRT